MIKNLRSLLRAQKGQALVEYALLICLIAICIGTTLTYFAHYLIAMFRHFVEVIAAWCA